MKRIFLFIIILIMCLTMSTALWSCDALKNDPPVNDEEQNSPDMEEKKEIFRYIERSDGTYSIAGILGVELPSELVIPSEKDGIPVTEIHDRAFWGKKIESVIIPASVELISSEAFLSCKNLTSVIFAEGSSLEIVSQGAFKECQSIENIYLPGSITKIEDEAFYQCTGLKSVTFGKGINLDVINIGVFYGCSALESIEIPDSVQKIETEAFMGCSNLESLAFGNESRLASIGIRAFFGCSKLYSVKIPDSVQRIETEAFRECKHLITFSIGEESNLASIGTYAFYDCISLNHIYFSSELIRIGEYAFSGCYGLDSITFAEDSKIKYIDICTFSGCRGLKTVILPMSINSFKAYAFSYCSPSVNVYYPGDLADWMNLYFVNEESSPVSSGGNLYLNGELLTSLTITKDMTYTSKYIFTGCGSLESVVFAEGVVKVDDYLFFGNTGIKNVSFSSTVESIGECAFANSVGIKNIIIPGTVKDIGEGAFKLTGIVNLTLEEGVVTIGENAFSSSKLASINFPTTLTTIEDFAFSSCSFLEKLLLPEGLKTVGYGAFKLCEGLISVTLPKSLETLGGDAFGWCTNLETIYIPASVEKIGSAIYYSPESFYNGVIMVCESESKPQGWADDWCSGYVAVFGAVGYGKTDDGYHWVEKTDGSLTIAKYTGSHKDIIRLPSEIDGKPVREIASRVFYEYGVYNTVHFVIPKSVEKVGKYAFYSNGYNYSYSGHKFKPEGWSDDWSFGNNISWGTEDLGVTENGLRWVVCNGTATIVEYVEYENNLIIPEQVNGYPVVAISDRVFDGRLSMESIVLPSTMAYIGEWAFRSCNTLTIYSRAASKPNSFGDDWNKKDVSYYCPVLWNYFDRGVSEDFEYVIHNDNTATITKYKSGSVNAVIPESIDGYVVTGIGNKLFYFNTTLKSVVIPATVTLIDESAFECCYALTSVTIEQESRLREIKKNAFYFCKALTSIDIPDGVRCIDFCAFAYCDELASVNISESSGLENIGALAFAGCRKIKSITLPEGLVTIGMGAFEETGLQSVVIPSSVTHIYGGFSGCNNLSSVTFREGSSLEYIGHAFAGTAITVLDLSMCESLKEIDSWTASGTTELKKLILPTSLEKINANAFTASAIESILVPTSVTYIGGYSFKDCERLTTVIFEDNSNIREIDIYAFQNCVALESISFGDNSKLEKILYECFSGCKKVKTIDFGANSVLKIIGYSAFKGCESLEAIFIPVTVQLIGYNTFENCPSLTIYCEIGCPPDGWENGWTPHPENVIWGYHQENSSN